jgi:hypothetical protein
MVVVLAMIVAAVLVARMEHSGGPLHNSAMERLHNHSHDHGGHNYSHGLAPTSFAAERSGDEDSRL